MSDSTVSTPADSLLPGDTLDSFILRVLMDTIPDHIYFKDRESRFVRNNTAHARSFGTTPEACVGKSDLDFFSKEHAERAYADEQRIMQSGQALVGHIERITRLDGSVFWGSATKLPWKDSHGNVIGTFGITRDVTKLKRVEDDMTEERNLLRTIIDHLPSRVFVKDTAGRYVLNNRAHLEVLGVKQSEAIGRSTLDFFPGERGQQAVADDRQVLAGGPPVMNQEKSDFQSGDNAHWSLTTKVPLRDSRGEVTGLVGISHDITRRKQAEDALVRRNAEVEADVRMACKVQEAFLPRTYPVFPRGVPVDASALHFGHRYIAATTLGGDFFHILQLSDTRCGLLICDVMGHGVRAGLLTALIRGVVEEMAGRAENPALVLSEINLSLTPIVEQTGEPVFATAFYAVVDTAAQTILYSNAGHPSPLVRRGATGKVDALVPDNPEPAAGLIEHFVYTSAEAPFLTGDMLLGFTDGIFEASNAQEEEFGEERLKLLVERHFSLSGRPLIDGIISEVVAFSGHEQFEDDICLVAIDSTGSVCALRPALNYEI